MKFPNPLDHIGPVTGLLPIENSSLVKIYTAVSHCEGVGNIYGSHLV
jgi:hypothetical protein